MPSIATRQVITFTATAAEWATYNDILQPNEVGIEYDTGLMKQGNGTDRWVTLDYMGGSNIQTVYSATVTLDNDDIKLLGDGGSGVEIVAAQGANKVIVYLGGVVRLVIAGVYTGMASGSAFNIQIGSGAVVSPLLPCETQLNTVGTHEALMQGFGITDQVPSTGDWERRVLTNFYSGGSALSNKALNIADFWAPGAYGGGNVGNSLTIDFLYSVMTLS